MDSGLLLQIGSLYFPLTQFCLLKSNLLPCKHGWWMIPGITLQIFRPTAACLLLVSSGSQGVGFALHLVTSGDSSLCHHGGVGYWHLVGRSQECSKGISHNALGGPHPPTKNYPPQIARELSSEALQVASVPLIRACHSTFVTMSDSALDLTLTPSFLFPILGNWSQTRRML